MKHRSLRIFALSSLLAASSGLSAQAALSYNYTDSGPIPQGGTVFSVEHAISGVPSPITGLELILTFNDSSSLSGNISGIEGHLILGTRADSPYADFFPVATYLAGQERIYDITFDGTPGSPGVALNGSDPNNTWGLVLWDNSTSGIQNGLTGWSLDITVVPVPEPIHEGLGVFAGLSVIAIIVRNASVRERFRRWRVGADRWVDVV